MLYQKKRYLDALQNNSQLLSVLRAAGHENTTHYFTIQGNRAMTLRSLGNLQGATAVREQLINRTSQSSQHSQIPKHIWVDHAHCLNLLGRHQDAARIFEREFIELSSSAVAILSQQKQFSLQIGYAYNLSALGKIKRAEQHFDNAKNIMGGFHGGSGSQHMFLQAEFVEAILLKKKGFKTKGNTLLLNLLDKLAKAKQPVRGLLLQGYFQGVSELIDRGDTGYAEEIVLNLLNIMPAPKKFSASSGDLGLVNLLLGKIYTAQGRYREANKKIHVAARQLTRGYGPAHPYSEALATLTVQ